MPQKFLQLVKTEFFMNFKDRKKRAFSKHDRAAESLISLGIAQFVTSFQAISRLLV